MGEGKKNEYKDRHGWSKGMTRCWVEERIGCIAVIDSKINKDIKHLDSETEGVVWFKMGVKVPTYHCPTCGNCCRTEWEVSQDLINDAIKKADIMNRGA